eukprot:6404853-Pyramimonas_sp.AAC.1
MMTLLGHLVVLHGLCFFASYEDKVFCTALGYLDDVWICAQTQKASHKSKHRPSSLASWKNLVLVDSEPELLCKTTRWLNKVLTVNSIGSSLCWCKYKRRMHPPP